jgi:hypothetical protein
MLLLDAGASVSFSDCVGLGEEGRIEARDRLGSGQRFCGPRFLVGDTGGDLEEDSVVIRNEATKRVTSIERMAIRSEIKADIALVRKDLHLVRCVASHPVRRTEVLFFLGYEFLLLRTADALLQRAETLERRPRPNVRFLFDLFMRQDDCDAIVGDLDEGFVSLKARNDHHRAVMWYWKQVIRSLAAVIWAATKTAPWR